MSYQYPATNEYPPYFQQYMSLVKSNTDIILQLKNEQDVMIEYIKSLPEEKLNYAYEKGKWTIKEVLLHIIDTERIFCYRALAIARGEKISLPGFDQDDYAKTSLAQERSRQSIIEEYSTNRAATIAMFNGFANTVHTNMGLANNNQISVRTIPFILAGHELHHKKVLKEKY